MLISDFLSWEWKTDADVEINIFENEIDPRKINWDLAIWGDPWLAKWAVENKKNKSSVSVLPDSWISGLSASADAYNGVLSRVPYSVARCAKVLAMASRHVIKSLATGGKEAGVFATYEASQGVWYQGTKEVNALIMDVLATDFAEAMNRAADFAIHIADEVLNVPSKPASNASAADKAKYAADLAAFKIMRNKAERIAKFEDSLKLDPTQSSIQKNWSRLVVEKEDAWDSDMNWIILKDRALDLGKILENRGDAWTEYDVAHSPFHMSTMALDVKWSDVVNLLSKDIDESAWFAGVNKVLPDVEVRGYLQKRFGAALLGKPGMVSKSMVWQYGFTNTAKSSIQECIAGSRGVFAPYSKNGVSADVLKKTENGEATSRFIAYSRGKRYVLMSEMDDSAPLNEAGLKTLTGGETVEGTAKYANGVSYHYTATIFMASNDVPTVRSGDKVVLDRIDVVPFTHVLYLENKNKKEWLAASEEHRAIPDWQDRILSSASERAAVLAWVIDGLFKYASEGLGMLPKAMEEAKEDFVESGKDAPQKVLDYLLTGGEVGRPIISVMTDSEWSSSGLMDKEGLTTDRLDTLIDHVLISGQVSYKYDVNKLKRVVARNLNSMGGRKKRVASETGSSHRPYAFTRVKENWDSTVFLSGSNSAVPQI